MAMSSFPKNIYYTVFEKTKTLIVRTNTDAGVSVFSLPQSFDVLSTFLYALTNKIGLVI